MKNFPSLTGIAVGIVIGFMIAPSKGFTIRKKIGGKTRYVADKLSGLLQDADIDLADIKTAFINEVLQLTSGLRESIYGIMGNLKALNDPEAEK